MPVTFRDATDADLPAIVALLADDDLAEGRGYPGTASEAQRRAFAEIELDPRQRLVVGVDAGAVVATLQLTFIPGLTFGGGERCQVEGVRVAPGRRGDGLGRRLLEHAVDEARVRGCVLVQLTSDKRRGGAIGFYEALGFAATHEGLKLRL